MAVTAVAPEYVLGDACMEWILATQSVYSMQAIGFTEWTRTHGFFGNMGGFMVLISDGTYRALTTAELHWLVSNGYIDIFNFSQKEIDDRSKADPLIKLLVCVQIAWYVLQFITRLAQHLAIGALEVVTAGFMTCSIIIYAFWMETPLDVGTPAIITSQQVGALVIVQMEECVKPSRHCTNWVDNSYLASREATIFNGLMGWSYDFIATCIVGCTLGAVHVAGWNIECPTRIEQILWRTASTITAAVPPVLSLAAAVLKPAERLHFNKMESKIELALSCMLFIPYVCGRAYLLVASVTSLRSMPASMYDVVTRSNVIPHV